MGLPFLAMAGIGLGLQAIGGYFNNKSGKELVKKAGRFSKGTQGWMNQMQGQNLMSMAQNAARVGGAGVDRGTYSGAFRGAGRNSYGMGRDINDLERGRIGTDAASNIYGGLFNSSLQQQGQMYQGMENRVGEANMAAHQNNWGSQMAGMGGALSGIGLGGYVGHQNLMDMMDYSKHYGRSYGPSGGLPDGFSGGRNSRMAHGYYDQNDYTTNNFSAATNKAAKAVGKMVFRF